MTIKKSMIPNRLKNASKEHPYVAGAEDIYDDALGKPQSTVNNEVGTALAEHTQEIEDLQAMEQIVIDGGEAQIAQGSDFDNPDATKRAKIPTVGAVLDGISDGVFDLTAKTGDSYATLNDALTAANSAIPTNKKKGGMSVKFVLSSDNKYIQARCMAQNFTTDVTQWQVVDETPVVDSKNLVESGGVAEETNSINQILQGLFNNKINQLVNVLQERVFTAGYVDITNGAIRSSSTFSYSNFIKVNNETYIAKCDTLYQMLICYYDSQKVFLSGITLNIGDTGRTFTIPNGTSYMVVSIDNRYIDTTVISPYYADRTINLLSFIGLNSNNDITQILNRIEFGFNNINTISIFGKENSSVVGKYIVPSSGNLDTNSSYFSSDFIDVDENKVYFVSNCHNLYGAFYNVNKEYISGITEGSDISYKEINPPVNAKYIRLSTNIDRLSVATFGAVNVSLSDKIDITQHPYIISLNKKAESSNYIVGNITTTSRISDVDVITGKYVDPFGGSLVNNANYSATEDYIQIEENKTYYFYGFTNIYGAWYDLSKNKIGDGIIRENSRRVYSVISPVGAAYLRVSGETTVFAGCSVSQSNYVLESNIKVPASQIIDSDNIITIEYNVKPNGGGDFTKLSDCFNAITDSSFSKRYIVNFYGDGTEYDTLVDKPYVSGQIGLRIPPFTKLIGVGGKEKNILVRRLELQDADQNDSLLNLYMTSELQGFTLIAEKTRYVVHDDFYASGELNHLDYERHISDIEVLGSNMYYDQVWGAGCYSGANWVFENCIFNSSQSLSYTCHNNSGFTNIAKQKFINCRFITTGTTSIRFGSITNDANNINNIVEFYGCVLKYVNLTEEKPATLGRGILFKVTGFGNDLRNGSANLVITNTDGEDYSANIDLI